MTIHFNRALNRACASLLDPVAKGRSRLTYDLSTKVFLRLVMSALARFSLRVGFSRHHGDGLAGSEQGPVPERVPSD